MCILKQEQKNVVNDKKRRIKKCFHPEAAANEKCLRIQRAHAAVGVTEGKWLKEAEEWEHGRCKDDLN